MKYDRRMICSNASCINKSIVYRNTASIALTCKACGGQLVQYVGEHEKRRIEQARKDLQELDGRPSLL